MYCLSMTRMSWDKRPWQSNAYDEVRDDLEEKEAIEQEITRRGLVSITAFLTLNTECPAGPYGRCDGTKLRLGFANQRFRHMLSTSQSALFLQAVAVGIVP
jgi:hypothetical protein